jgi:hypothetical protein
MYIYIYVRTVVPIRMHAHGGNRGYYWSYKRPSYKTFVCQLVFGTLAVRKSSMDQI